MTDEPSALPKVTPRWRFEVALTDPVPQPLLPYENYLDSVWLELQVIHTAFRGVDQAEYWTLIQKVQDIERIFLDRPELDEYYTECNMNEKAVHDQFHKNEFGLLHPTRE